MNKFFALLLCLATIQVLYAQKPDAPKPEETVISAEDQTILQNTLKQFQADSKLATGELVLKIAQSFEGKPYISHTLENDQEKLVANLHEFDCTTLVESCLALALTIKSEHPSEQIFLQNLQYIRYRNGIRDQYPSRLHYFSDWLDNNAKKHLIALPVTKFGIPFPTPVNFMSTHPDSYDALKNNPSFVERISQTEKEIAQEKHVYITKEQLPKFDKELHEGDIVGITTNIAGLDIAHTGFLIRINGKIHLLHASSDLKKVVVSDVPLYDYLLAHKKQTGIIIGRPL